MITPGLLGSLMGSMGGGAPGAPLDLAGMVKLPPCAVCLSVAERDDTVAPPAASSLVLGTLVCDDCARQLVRDLTRTLRAGHAAPIPRDEQEVGQCIPCAKVGRVCLPYHYMGQHPECTQKHPNVKEGE